MTSALRGQRLVTLVAMETRVTIALDARAPQRLFGRRWRLTSFAPGVAGIDRGKPGGPGDAKPIPCWNVLIQSPDTAPSSKTWPGPGILNDDLGSRAGTRPCIGRICQPRCLMA